MNATHWISIGQALATAFVGIVAVVITYRMQSKQIDIANGLREIARAQHETAATKLRLELFETRFEAYRKVVLCLDEICEYTAPKDHRFVFDLNKRYVDACTPFRYLFNSSIHLYLMKDVSDIIAGYIHYTNEDYDSKPGEITPFSKATSDYFFGLQKAYKELDKMVGSFLIIEKEKPLIEQDDQS